MANQIAKIDDLVNSIFPEYTNTIAQFQWALVPESQKHAAVVQLTKSSYIEKIAKSQPESVRTALIQAATLGLDLTDGKRQGWLLPRKAANGLTVVVLQVGYKGVEAINQRMGVIDRLMVRVVREGDDFEWSGDDAEKPTHVAKAIGGESQNWFATDAERGQIVGAFAVTYLPDGTTITATAPISTIFEKHRDTSDSYKSYLDKKAKGENPFPPPWVTFEEEMVLKTMTYIAAKRWPANIRDSEISSNIISTLDEVDFADYQSMRNGYTQEQKAMFDEFLAASDGLGMYLLESYLRGTDENVFSRLYNSAEKGKKVATKKAVDDLLAVGLEAYRFIEQAFDADDITLLLENIDDSTDNAIKLLRRFLGRERSAWLDSVIEEYGDSTIIDGETVDDETAAPQGDDATDQEADDASA